MTNLLDINADNWRTDVLESPILAVVYFYHDKCPWSREFNPILKKVAGEYTGRISFVRMNVLSKRREHESCSPSWC